MTTSVASGIEELAVVELTRALDGFKKGTVGTVISARPESDAYTIEIVSGSGRPAGFVSAQARDLRVRHRPIEF